MNWKSSLWGIYEEDYEMMLTSIWQSDECQMTGFFDFIIDFVFVFVASAADDASTLSSAAIIN